MTRKKSDEIKINEEKFNEHLSYLKLPTIQAIYKESLQQGADKGWSHLEFLACLVREEVLERQQRRTERRVTQAHFPTIKTLEQFDWHWPRSINEMAVKNQFRLQFIKDKTNVIFLGPVGTGKSHLCVALAYKACLADHTVLFTTAIEAVNTLAAAQKIGRLEHELKKYLKPQLLVLDELGFLPIDKLGADLLFQIISRRYEKGSIMITSNRAYKDWPAIFNNDATLTSALLDRLLHHAETMMIRGKSYRMKDQVK